MLRCIKIYNDRESALADDTIMSPVLALVNDNGAQKVLSIETGYPFDIVEFTVNDNNELGIRKFQPHQGCFSYTSSRKLDIVDDYL